VGQGSHELRRARTSETLNTKVKLKLKLLWLKLLWLKLVTIITVV